MPQLLDELLATTFLPKNACSFDEIVLRLKSCLENYFMKITFAFFATDK